MEDNREMAILSKRLVTIAIDSPVDCELEDLIKKEVNAESLKPLFQELEFKTLHKRVFNEEQEDTGSQLKSLSDVKIPI